MGKSDSELHQLGYNYLGWANGWSKNPPELQKCRDEKHSMNEISYSPRGSDHTVYCDICKIWYKYDSSD